MHIQDFFFPSPTPNALIGVCAFHKHHIELNNTDKTCKNNNFFTEGSSWHPVRRFIPFLQHKLSGQSWLTSQGSNHWKFLADILQKVYSVQVLCSSLASAVEHDTFPAGWVRYLPSTRSDRVMFQPFSKEVLWDGQRRTRDWWGMKKESF